MMLTGTCKESDAHMILKNLCLTSYDTVFIREISFLRLELTMEVYSKSTKEKTIGKLSNY